MIEQKAEFGQYYEQYQPEIYNYFYNRIGNIWHSQDLTSETFFKGFKAIDRYRPTGIPIGAWFYMIAHNLLVDYYKGSPPAYLDTLLPTPVNRRNPHAPTFGETLLDLDKRNDPVIQAEQHFMADKLREGIGKLSPYFQQVVTMYYLEERSYKEIAQKTGKSEGVLRVARLRAISKLKEELKGVLNKDEI